MMTKKLEPVLRENLLRHARAYQVAKPGNSLRSISRLAHGDPPFFDKLAAGEGSFTARKYDEVMAWFDKNWPENVQRPVPVNPIHGRIPKPKPKKATK